MLKVSPSNLKKMKKKMKFWTLIRKEERIMEKVEV